MALRSGDCPGIEDNVSASDDTMTKKIIFHVGPHKTGTTSIQAMLFSQSRSKNCEFVYPFTSPGEIGQHDFARLACSPDQSAFLEKLGILKSLTKTCVLSSEELCYLPAAGMRSLRDAVPDAHVTIVYYQRDVLSLLYSWWQETIKHGSVQTLSDFALRCILAPYHLHLFVPDALLGGWASVFGREAIRIFRYDHIPDVAKHFAYNILALDLPAESLSPSNRSYDQIDCEMMRFWNRQGFWGAGLVQASGYPGIRAQFAARCDAFTETFHLSYRRSEFSEIENSLISRWHDRIEGYDGGPLFTTREKAYSYIHPDVWAVDPGLITEMRAFAQQHPEFSRQR